MTEDCPYCSYDNDGVEGERAPDDPEPSCPWHETVWPHVRMHSLVGKVKITDEYDDVEKQSPEEWWESVKHYR